jgi:capsule polysaccharide export protein KpsE/RkpR
MDAAFEPVRALLQRWKLIALAAVIGACAGATYLFVAPPWYEATLTVVPSQRSQDAAAMSLASKLPFGFDSMTTDVQRIHAVLISASVADAVIEKFDLDHRYGTSHREKTRMALAEHCRAAFDRKSSVVSLTCEDKDPKVAMQIASYFGEVGNRVFGRISASSAREERKFLEAQVAKARSDVDQASEKLRQFQEEHKIIDLPEQSKAVISAMASIQGDLLSKQLQLSYLSSFSAPTESQVVQVQEQIEIMKRKLAQLEDESTAKPGAGSASGSDNKEFFPDAMRVPDLRYQLEQLLREQKIQETLFFLLTQRYEMAKVDEARDTSTFQILDEPTLPTMKSRPRRGTTLIATTALAAVLAAAWVLIPAWWRSRVRAPLA